MGTRDRDKRGKRVIDQVRVRVLSIPTDQPEADGTLAWSNTTMIVVEVDSGGCHGLGFTYSDGSAARLIKHTLAPVLVGKDAAAPQAATAVLRRQVRNVGRSGIAACAISALDIALWDLKARLLDMPLVTLLGQRRDAATIYGSGGFTTYDDPTLQAQLANWVETDGCNAVKIKIGTDPQADPHRVAMARQAIGSAALYVDANGAFTPRAALRMAEQLAEYDISWFEEPVSSDDLVGMAFVRSRIGPKIDIAAGEYSFTIDDTRHMLQAGATDVQQIDITRCGGVTGFLQAAAICDAYHVDVSAHCAPSAHCHVVCAAPRFRNLEWFHDHVRIEQQLFDGAPRARGGTVTPDLSRPGHGLTLREKEAQAYAVNSD